MFVSEARCKMPMRPILMLITYEKIPDYQVGCIVGIFVHERNTYIGICEKNIVFHDPHIVTNSLIVCEIVNSLVPGYRCLGDYRTGIKKTIFASDGVIYIYALGSRRKFGWLIVGYYYYLAATNIRQRICKTQSGRQWGRCKNQEWTMHSCTPRWCECALSTILA